MVISELTIALRLLILLLHLCKFRLSLRKNPLRLLRICFIYKNIDTVKAKAGHRMHCNSASGVLMISRYSVFLRSSAISSASTTFLALYILTILITRNYILFFMQFRILRILSFYPPTHWHLTRSVLQLQYCDDFVAVHFAIFYKA